MTTGKSTLARELAEHRNAILLVQDELLEHLVPGEITDMAGFFERSSRLRRALTPHICAVLSKGISVVLDFPGNTKAQRAWFRELFERAHVEHELHCIDASDAVCKRQLRERSRHLPPGTHGVQPLPAVWMSQLRENRPVHRASHIKPLKSAACNDHYPTSHLSY